MQSSGGPHVPTTHVTMATDSTYALHELTYFGDDVIVPKGSIH